jgi:exodeoxyribonuclease VII large subunit
MELVASHDDATSSIAQLYGELTGYLDAAWGRAHQRWVFGEIQKYADHRSGHCYLDLVDPTASGRDTPTLKAKCWRTTWSAIRMAVAKAGLELEEGVVVRVKGYVDLYAPRGELGFIVTALDIEALRVSVMGEHARRREELIRSLVAEGLFDANRARAIAAVPILVGLVASKETEGCSDFLGMLEASGFGFRVTLVHAAVQGSRAPLEVARAIGSLSDRACDVICVVRGGGSQADLGAFDHERVARAIATSAVPVFTGIGHTGDVSVADLVANQSFRTPTACAEALGAMVREWYAEHVAAAAARIDNAVVGLLDELDATVDQSRRHLVVVGRHQLARAGQLRAAAAGSVARRVPHVLALAGSSITDAARRLGPLAQRHTATAADGLVSRRALLAAYDPSRLLARGWSITTDDAGRVVRTVEGLRAGQALATMLADGVARSTVTGVEHGDG